jgi:two-component system sensor histidine kinase MprB
MQVKQIVTNLLVNSLKFTPMAGRVTVSVRSAAPTSATSGPAARHHAEVVVSDTGPGIPVEERERVFERGVRLARDQALPGSGIGLAVVRELATLHGGSAHVEETPGGGAAVVVRLPFDMRVRRDDGGRP